MDLSATQTARSDRLDIDPADLHDEYGARHLDELADEQLFALAARVIAIPKQDPANSFILHAPLELLARRALLRVARPDRREGVRERMLWVAATYERTADPIDGTTSAAFDSTAAAASALLAAAAAKDLETVDATTVWLGLNAATDDIMSFAPAMIDSLAAAGHASIYFFLLSRTAANSRAALGLLRPLAREVARLPELRIEWTRGGVAARGSGGARFAEALAGAPRLGLPGSDFVFPTVHQVDAGGQARDIVNAALPSDFTAASRAVLRVAAQSMLQDDPRFAPYGWSHCLTLPQSVLGIAPWLSDPTEAAAIAATYVVAFRSAESSRAIDTDWVPEPTRVALRDALDAAPDTASSAAYHASEEELEALVPELAAHAGSHEDAHLAKYTLACLDAATYDPEQRRLYLAAAAYLRAWWSQHGQH